MIAAFSISGIASLLLAAALLATGACADHVTLQQCTSREYHERIRSYPVDVYGDRLALYACNLTEINPAYWAGIIELDIIDLTDNGIVSINPAVFRSVPKLTALWMGRNNVRELPVFIERSCPSLATFSLSHNLLTEINDASTFSSCGKLANLYLSGNQIEYIHPDVFKPLIELKRLFLDHNKIKFIPHQMYGVNGQLEWRWVNYNHTSDSSGHFRGMSE